jgi:hypothetical protein
LNRFFRPTRRDNRLVVRRVARRVNAVRKHNPDRKAVNFPPEFVPGGSSGPVNPA